MASLGHVAVGLAAGRLADRQRPVGPMLWLSALSLLPDADVLGFRFGVAYADAFGHRGASHSLLVGLVVGVLAGLAIPLGDLSRVKRMVLCTLVVCSHGLLDTLTDGGLGVALLWPASAQRFFAPLRPIPVAPIGRRLLSAWGARVMLTELVMFAPFVFYALWPRRRADVASEMR